MNTAEIRRLGQEDLKLQLDAALHSAHHLNFSTARAELRGAIMILDGIEKKVRESIGGDPDILSRWA